jgi:uncharacterized protein with PQ loop repeat
MKKFECDLCKKKFKTDVALRQHKNSKHFHQQKPMAYEQKTRSRIITKKHTKRLWLYFIIVVIFGFFAWGIYATITNSSQIGALGSAHIHADFAIFLDGRELTPLPPKYFERSQYIHMEKGPGAGSVIHMHATNVPLSLFFRSLGMSFDSNCFKLDTGQEYCNNGNRTLKMYVKHVDSDWEENFEYGDYVFNDLDKILISFGNETEDELRLQMDSVTDFAGEDTIV